MKTIDELLDEYHLASRIYGMALDGPIPSPEVTEWQGKQDAARAAVDAKVKELQDRIAELEKQQEKILSTAKSDAVLLLRYHTWCEQNNCAPSTSDLYSVTIPTFLKNLEVMSETTPVSEIK